MKQTYKEYYYEYRDNNPKPIKMNPLGEIWSGGESAGGTVWVKDTKKIDKD